MSQQKAASLTSSLFARKGKASPASLLISELEAAGEATARGAANGAGNGRSTNGRRRAPKPVEALPLLAFVEAQASRCETESDTAEEPAAPLAEPAPAASLLERGTRSWRRANGHALPLPACDVTLVKSPVTSESPTAGSGEAAPEDRGQASTISGDANVSAIEDAPRDEAVAEETFEAAAPAEAAREADAILQPAAEDGEGAAPAPRASEAPAPAAPEPRFTGPRFTGPQSTGPESTGPESTGPESTGSESTGPESTGPNPRGPAALEPPGAGGQPQAAIPATLALRKAAALRIAPPAEAVSPQPEGTVRRHEAGSPRTTTLWRSAAVVAFGAVLGFGLYLAVGGKGEVAEQPVAATPAPEVTPPATPSVVAALPPEAEAPAVAALVVSEPSTPEPISPAAAAALPEPSFDIIRIEPDGRSIIAGRAAPGSEWILLNNGNPIAAVRADAKGEWVVLPDSALVPGANAFSLVPKAERGTVTIPAPAPEPADHGAGRASGAAEAADPAPGPRAEAPLPALPKAKPPVPAFDTTVFRAAAEGAYEIQLASVRDSADANRERVRLSGAFSDLLGKMDLRVQQASLEGAGVFYRVRSGAIDDLAVARELCRRLETAGQRCLVVRRPEARVETVADDLPDAATAVRQQAAERPR